MKFCMGYFTQKNIMLHRTKCPLLMAFFGPSEVRATRRASDQESNLDYFDLSEVRATS